MSAEEINFNMLGKKKLRITDLVDDNSKVTDIVTGKKNKNNYANTDNLSDEEEEDEDMKNYKNLISGKINIKNILSSNPNSNIFSQMDNNKKDNSESITEKKNIPKNIKTSLTEKLLNLLPKPKIELKDKQLNIKPKNNISDNIEDKYKSLANPDSDIFHNNNSDNITREIFNNPMLNRSNLIDINVNEQVDKNWETKYLTSSNLTNTPTTTDPTYQQNNKNHIKALVSNYQKDKAIKEEENSIRSSKISTRNKYGW
jgi:hypothetical protein